MKVQRQPTAAQQPPQPLGRLAVAVLAVAQHGGLEGGGAVHAELVLAAGFGSESDEGAVGFEVVEDAVVCDSGLDFR